MALLNLKYCGRYIYVTSIFHIAPVQNSDCCFRICFQIVRWQKKLTIGNAKMAYNITHGLSPYFHNHAEQLISSAKYIVVCFDESLNEVIQKEKMDICVRLWDLNRNKVAARYFSSAFLGHTTAEDLFDGFTTVLNNETLRKILQVSMDGPSVHWKFFDALNDDFEEMGWGHVDCMWYMELSKMAIRMQCGMLILFEEAFRSSFMITLLEEQIT